MIFLQAAGIFSPANLILLLIPLVLYFFTYKPQMEQNKAQQSFGNSLEKGKEVVTTGGVIGKINKIEGLVVTLEVDKNTFLRVTKSSIDRSLTESYAKATAAEKV